MTKEELLQSIAFLEKDMETTAELFILDEPADNEDDGLDVNVYKGRMHEKMPKQITDLFFPKLKRILIKRDYELKSYDPSLTPDRNVVWQQPVTQVPFYNLVMKKLQSAHNRYYNNETLPYDRIWAIWIKLHAGRQNFYLLKRITPSKIITTGGVLAWVFSGDTFKGLTNDVLTIDDHFDAFVCDGTLIFENKQNFEKALQFETIIQQIADETLKDIKQIGIVENFDELKTMLADDYHSIRKLNKLRQKQYFKEKTFNDYLKIIRDYNVAVTVDTKNKQFKVANKAQAKLLIKVLNDDYLRSDLTNLKYAANSKEDV